MSTLETTVSMMKDLSENELILINNYVRRIINYKSNFEIYKPLSEKEFFERLAIARKHASEGKVKDAAKVAENVRGRYGLA